MPSGGMELLREADSVLKEEPDVESKKSHDFREFFVQIHFRILDFLCHTLLCFDFLIVRVTLGTRHLYNWS